MHSFSVNTTDISSASTKISTIVADIESSVQQMMTALTNLETTWTGSAATSFAALRDDWKITQDTVREDLKTIGDTLSKAGVTYADTETSNKSLFTTTK